MHSTVSLAESIASLPETQRKKILADLTDAELGALEFDWRFWSRPDQLAPETAWTYWLILAGRGWGKTRTGAEWVRKTAQTVDMVNLIGATADDARDIMIEGESGVLSVCPDSERPQYRKSERKLIWPNGATSLVFTADEPERLRGKQHKALWADELAAWRYPESWDQAKFGLRLGANPQAVITTTPRPIGMLRDLIKDPGCVITRGTTYDNRANLAPAFFDAIIRRYEGTRLGRQELAAELLDDLPGALWKREWFDKHRRKANDDTLPDMQRVVVAVDPSGTKGDGEGDDIGIVVAGKGIDGRGYILGDYSCNLSPDGWGRRAVYAYNAHKADRIVAEVNYGGAMVAHVIRTVDRETPYRDVHASRGKVVRAEPIAALYEQGRVSHVGAFAELEDQMCLFGPDGYVGEGSPDRADAAVWALTDLFMESTEAHTIEVEGLY